MLISHFSSLADEDPAIERKLEQIYQICSQLPVLANATLVAHPDFCNAYVVCGNGVATTPCEVCSVGTYFPDTADRWVRAGGEALLRGVFEHVCDCLLACYLATFNEDE